MSTKILFIFEGKDTEKSITDSLTKFFLNENVIVTCAFCTTIYKLYADISKDEDLDTFSLIKEIEFNKSILENYNRTDFAEIYMFFDYDCHASNASDYKLSSLLEFFNEETEKGKLYISYPMVESLKHIENIESFKSLTIPCSDLIYYKNIVSENCISNYKHFHLYNVNIWKEIIIIHLKKMNYIVNDIFELPIIIEKQQTIFSSQQLKYININNTVSVLSAFPIFLFDYYGNEEIRNRII